jgi:hypothetical protein
VNDVKSAENIPLALLTGTEKLIQSPAGDIGLDSMPLEVRKALTASMVA